MSPETINLLMGVLSQVQIQVGDPEFLDHAMQLASAKQELEEELKKVTSKKEVNTSEETPTPNP